MRASSDGDGGACAGEPQGKRAADAAARACDESYPVCQLRTLDGRNYTFRVGPGEP